MYKKILVPLDGSLTSKKGLAEAIRLATYHHARLRLIHVVDVFVVTPTLASGISTDDIYRSVRESGAKLLRDATTLVQKHRLKADSAMFEIGSSQTAADIIVAQAKKWRADIIVIGTHGRRGISRIVMGSDAEQIIRCSPVPVLLIRQNRRRY